MTKTTKRQAAREAMYARIEHHGRQLLAIFPRATERDPIKLCKRLRRAELAANHNAVLLCNGDLQQEDYEVLQDAISIGVCAMLSSPRPWINGDPRGYALKIDLQPGEDLYRDWGGYGIIAPDLTESA